MNQIYYKGDIYGGVGEDVTNKQYSEVTIHNPITNEDETFNPIGGQNAEIFNSYNGVSRNIATTPNSQIKGSGNKDLTRNGQGSFNDIQGSGNIDIDSGFLRGNGYENFIDGSSFTNFNGYTCKIKNVIHNNINGYSHKIENVLFSNVNGSGNIIKNNNHINNNGDYNEINNISGGLFYGNSNKVNSYPNVDTFIDLDTELSPITIESYSTRQFVDSNNQIWTVGDSFDKENHTFTNGCYSISQDFVYLDGFRRYVVYKELINNSSFRSGGHNIYTFGDSNDVLLNNNTNHNFILGNTNLVTGEVICGIVYGQNNIVESNYCSAVLGVNNVLRSSNFGYNCLLVTGHSNLVEQSYQGIVAGVGNQIYKGQSPIVFGQENIIGESGQGNAGIFSGAMVSGRRNQVFHAEDGTHILGSNNDIKIADLSTLVCGYANEIINHATASLISGGRNKVTNYFYSFITGSNNTVVDQASSSVISGTGNEIIDAAISFIGGQSNTLGNVSTSIIYGRQISVPEREESDPILTVADSLIVGSNHKIRSAISNCTILGDNHILQGTLLFDTILGSENTVTQNHYSFITGYHNNLTGTNPNSTLNVIGNSNTLTSGDNTLVLGSNNTITGGGSNITILGNSNLAQGGNSNAYVFGTGIYISGGCSNITILGSYNTTTNVNPTTNTSLLIGNGIDDNNRSDAYEIKKDGTQVFYFKDKNVSNTLGIGKITLQQDLITIESLKTNSNNEKETVTFTFEELKQLKNNSQLPNLNNNSYPINS